MFRALGMRLGRRFAAIERPAPRAVVALYLSWRWGANVSLGADVRYPGRLRLGKGSRLRRCQIICTGPIVIEADAEVRDFAIIDAQNGPVHIGAHTTVNPYCVLYGAGGLDIGRNVAIATHVVIIPANHGTAALDRPIIEQPVEQRGVVVRDNVWIAAHSVILDGTEIGAGAVVAAGAVVTRSVAPDDIVAGVPARPVRNRRTGAAGR